MKDTIKFKRLLLQDEHFAEGAFSQVFKAKYYQSTVCVKKIKIKQVSESSVILKEISLLRKCQHENVVKLIGHCENDKHMYIVTEWIEGGTLRQYLKDYLIELSWQARVDIAKGIALALQSMHNKGILHRDIKSRNILIERKQNKPKVCDFGFAAEMNDPDVANTRCGTGEWMAPELYNNGTGTRSDKIDIFSYGIVLVEIITRKNIARDLPRSAAANYGLDTELLKLHTPLDCPLEFLDLAISCCTFCPQARPTWNEIVYCLDEMSASLPPLEQCLDSDEDEIFNTSTDTNDADDDCDADGDDEQTSPPTTPHITAHSLPFFMRSSNTPVPSPCASPVLSRPKKTAAVRLISYDRNGNVSDSGSNSSGSRRYHASNSSTPTNSPPQSPRRNSSTRTLRNSPVMSSVPCFHQARLRRNSNATSSHPTSELLRPTSPSASASALELTTPQHQLSLQVEGPSKSKTNAMSLLRRLAPLRFTRSRSDPCIIVYATTPQTQVNDDVEPNPVRPDMIRRRTKLNVQCLGTADGEETDLSNINKACDQDLDEEQLHGGNHTNRMHLQREDSSRVDNAIGHDNEQANDTNTHESKAKDIFSSIREAHLRESGSLKATKKKQRKTLWKLIVGK